MPPSLLSNIFKLIFPPKSAFHSNISILITFSKSLRFRILGISSLNILPPLSSHILKKTYQALLLYFLWSSMTTSLILCHNINTFGLTSHSGSLVYMLNYLPKASMIKNKQKNHYHIHS